MALGVPRTIEPMEARQVEALPVGPEWQYEPKWDGFRCLVFRDGDVVDLRSKAGKPLGRYFPDIVAAALGLRAPRFVLDGEIVVPVDGTLSFDQLLQRIHPAASRVKMLAATYPALLVVFDLLADAQSLVRRPLAERRRALEAFPLSGAVRLSPATTDIAVARRWLGRTRTGLDGVVAKRLDMPYAAGTREGMEKVKRVRTADCVVGGFRYATRGRVIGSLLLGLYDGEGLLDHVGFTSSFTAAQKVEWTQRVERLAGGAGFTGRAPGGPSRWSTERSAAWTPLAPKLVVEVRYDQFSEGRFRHGTALVRERPDKAPRQCTFDQLEPAGRTALKLLSGKVAARRGVGRR
ncbi:MAG TPA: ATP-dependent DNA ligase [Gemmatimonadaceae bacterium]|nr:ATP-dependent DNA ligase [Gemmatimonadaceae bacterium]